MDREIGIPGDLFIDHDLVFPMTEELPSSAWHITSQMKELHSLGVDGSNVSVAVNDTGFGNHPFLGKFEHTESFIGGESFYDGNGHGSHVGGIVKAVAPKCKLIGAKVLSNRGSGSTTGINRGRIWAGSVGADVISESLGDGGGPPIQEDLRAYDEAYSNGVAICCAALGNAGYNGRTTIGRPGSYSDHNHGIAALTSDWRTIANFSSGGPQAAYAAPGAGIVSCRPSGGWVSMSGTSMATPWQAGFYALVISWRRKQGMVELIGPKAWHNFFKENDLIIDLGTPGWDARYGLGRVNYVRTFTLMINSLKYV